MPSDTPAPDNDRYLTLAAPARAEPPKTKGSRFIGEAFPAEDEAAVAERLDAVRRREHAATHHCWAWRRAPDGADWRYSDDGEPSGTAGLPILREIEGRRLAGVLVVVTRYYGGTKLGTGGLARAYAEAAALVLDAAPKTEVVVRVPVRLHFAFADTSPAMRTVERFDAEVAETAYSAEGTELLVRVRASQAAALADAFVEALGGRGEVTVEG
ncbi:MAG TPA: YigZ family protein [Rubricoccaceae bacterium]|nr:YigZ family protein [Rubricoccaceae bacterium]